MPEAGMLGCPTDCLDFAAMLQDQRTQPVDDGMRQAGAGMSGSVWFRDSGVCAGRNLEESEKIAALRPCRKPCRLSSGIEQTLPRCYRTRELSRSMTGCRRPAPAGQRSAVSVVWRFGACAGRNREESEKIAGQRLCRRFCWLSNSLPRLCRNATGPANSVDR